MNKIVSPKITALTFGVLAIVFLAAFYVVAWQEPGQAPPQGNAPTPLNVGPIGQSKEGGLILNTGNAPNGLVIDKGNLCLGADCRDSWPTGAIPSGMIAMFDASCPSDWTRFTALDNKFPQGSAAYGGTGGVSTHSHSVSGATGYGSVSINATVGAYTTAPFSYHTHTHNFTANTNSVSNLPPYLNVIWCKKN